MTRMTLENIRDRGWNTKQLYLFWNFVCERHHIWRRRVLDGMSPPWTGDPILSQYFFTNVYRQLDKGTIYYFQQVIRGHEEDASLNDLIFNTLIYRLFNRIETFEYLGFTPHGKWHFSEKAQLLEKYQDTEQKVFTDAFTVTGSKFGNYDSKVWNICYLIDTLQDRVSEYAQQVRRASSMEKVFKLTEQLPGFGAFLAYEITIDLNYWLTRFSEDDFVNIGPGCLEGIRYIFGAKTDKKQAEKYLRELRVHQRDFFQMFSLDFPFLMVEGEQVELSLRNIEHSLCEASKYFRVRTGVKADGRRTSARTRRFRTK